MTNDTALTTPYRIKTGDHFDWSPCGTALIVQ